MKKMKSTLCVALLSVFLAGNVFAADSFGSSFFSFFGNAVQAVVSMFSVDDCIGKQCQNCKPKEEGGNGDCRPTQN